MKSAKDLPYNFGVKMQAYPSSDQKRIIDKNINFARFYYVDYDPETDERRRQWF